MNNTKSAVVEILPDLNVSQFAGTPPKVDPFSEPNTIRFDSDELKHGFTQVPNVVLRDTRLSGNDVRLYALLLSYAWRKDSCWPGQAKLCTDMGCSPRTVVHSMLRLKTLKFIRVKRRGLGKVNIYYIRRLSDSYGKQIVDKAALG